MIRRSIDEETKTKQEKKKSEIYDHRCRALQKKKKSFSFFFLLETLKKTHPSPYLVVFSVWCVHVTFHWAVCVYAQCHSRLGGDLCLLACVTTVLFLGSFGLLLLLCLRPPIHLLSDTHDNIQVVKMSPFPMEKRRKNPSEECWAPLGGKEKATQGTRSSQIRAYTPPHQKSFSTNFY